VCGRHPVLEVTVWNCIIRIPEILLVKFFFSVRVVQLWKKLPEEVVSASSVSAFISRLNLMRVSFLMFCFSAVCFLIYVSFSAVVSAIWAFLSSRHSSALYCFYCIVSVLMNRISIHSNTQITVNSLGNPCSQSWRRKKGCGGKYLQKREVLSLERKSEWVMEY